ncbi:MAG TPA: twin-arginine translocation signal domain-containing protein, partial [Anaerolineales bacterium]|nr:twin-arginine translocation signal domain-containing protein [Anaerolineales bacterium]
MSKDKKINRREFLQLAMAGTAGAALAGCTTPATPTPATAPTTPPTTAPEVTLPPATEVATEEAMSSELIGKLEGPEIIRDITQFPKKMLLSQPPFF